MFTDESQGSRKVCGTLGSAITYLFNEWLSNSILFYMKNVVGGRLGGLVGWASDFSSGHDLKVLGFKPRVGLCADSSEPGACFGSCVSLSLCPTPAHALSLSLSKINKHLKNFFKHSIIVPYFKDY